MKKRTVALLSAVIMLICVVFVGTMAWLNKGSAPVTNTFTTGKVKMELTETERDYIMVPGTDLPKDPTVIVEEGSQSCYLFVKVNTNITSKDPISWNQATGWELVQGEENVYYREFNKDDETLQVTNIEVAKKDGTTTTHRGYAFPFLEESQVSVSPDLTKEQMKDYNDPKLYLNFTAYAIQKDNLTDEKGEALSPAGAWALVKDAQPTATQNA